MNGDGEMGGDRIAESSSRSHASLWLTLALAAALSIAYLTVPTFQAWVMQAWDVLRSGERERISDWIAQYGVWGPIVLVTAMTLQMFLLIVPSVLLMTVAILAYGAWWGGMLAVTAVVIASSIGYLLGSALGAGSIDRLLGGGMVERTRWFIDRYGVWTVIVVRLSPFLSNDAISLVAGVLQMNALKFILATVVGVSPLVAAIAYVGAHTDHVAEMFGWVSGFSLLILVGVVWLDRKRKTDD